MKPISNAPPQTTGDVARARTRSFASLAAARSSPYESRKAMRRSRMRCSRVLISWSSDASLRIRLSVRGGWLTLELPQRGCEQQLGHLRLDVERERTGSDEIEHRRDDDGQGPARTRADGPDDAGRYERQPRRHGEHRDHD